MDELKFNDGTILTGSYAALTNTALFLYIQNGMTIVELFPILTDPTKTSEIVYGENTEHPQIYTGFTKLQSISVGVNGLVSAVMVR